MTQADPFSLLDLDEPVHRWSLERLLTDTRGFGLTTASPLQRAICRILDGLPLRDLAWDPEVIEALGGTEAVRLLPNTRPSEFVLLAAIRCGKSLIAALCGVRAAISCDMSRLSVGDEVRVPIVSTKTKTARQTWSHVRGGIMKSPELRKLLVGKPTAGSLFIRHPSGRPVEICIIAGGRAADTLISSYLASVIFDEAPRMLGQGDAVVNLDESRNAITGRILTGGQMLYIGSPHAPFGPVYEMVGEHHGKPSADMVVVRARGPWMNPGHWTPERCEDFRRRNPDAYKVDVLCEFLAPGETMIALHEVQQCVMFEGPIEPNPLWSYVAVMDPATRGNGWTLILLANPGGARAVVVLTRQWIGHASAPLSPRIVLQEIASILAPFGVSTVDSDQWSADALKDLAISCGLYLRTHVVAGQERVEQFERVRAYVTDRRLGMCSEPGLIKDLGAVQKRVTQSAITIDLPLTSDGRHCDYAAALALGLAQNLPEPTAATPEPTERDYTNERKAELQRRIEMTTKRRGMVMPP